MVNQKRRMEELGGLASNFNQVCRGNSKPKVSVQRNGKALPCVAQMNYYMS